MILLLLAAGLACPIDSGKSLPCGGAPPAAPAKLRKFCGKEDCSFMDALGKVTLTLAAEEVRGFSEGLAAFRRGDKWGYVDEKGEEAMAPAFDRAGDFHEGVAPVKRGNGWSYVDKTGATVLGPLPVESAAPFQEGLARVTFDCAKRERFGGTVLACKAGCLDRGGRIQGACVESFGGPVSAGP